MAGTRKKHRASSPSKRKGEGEEKIKEGERERERGGEQGSSKKSSNEGITRSDAHGLFQYYGR